MSTEDVILTFLSSSPDAVIDDTYPWSSSKNLDHAKVVGAIKSLLVEQYVAAEDLKSSFYSLTKEGESIIADGSQEVLVLKALNEAGKLSMGDLQAKVGKNVAKIGMGNCMKSKWIKKDGGDLVPLKKDDEVEDSVQKLLLELKAADFKPDAISDKVRIVFRVSDRVQKVSEFVERFKCSRSITFNHDKCRDS
jgi:phenylalanyl-tRNA synthetase alpha chain